MSDEAKKINEELARRRRELEVDEPDPEKLQREQASARGPAEVEVDWKSFAPEWVSRLETLDEPSARAWDERVRRINAGTATEEDVRIQDMARVALANGRPLPAPAKRMPGPEKLSRHWRPAVYDTIDRAVAIGIPPLIAERVVAGERIETRSTRALRKIGPRCSILVISGERGCGKSYAAGDWIWSLRYEPPLFLATRVAPRRFLEAHALFEVPYEDRPKLGMALAFVLDDAGTEKDVLVPDITSILVQRYRNHLPTVVTTNLNQADFEERYGMRFADRMREVGEFIVVSNDPGDSLRGR